MLKARSYRELGSLSLVPDDFIVKLIFCVKVGKFYLKNVCDENRLLIYGRMNSAL